MNRELVLSSLFNCDFYSKRVPLVDVYEKDESYSFQMELPGLTKEDIEIKYEDGILSFSGKKKEKEESKDKKYFLKEIHSLAFERSFRLDDVDIDGAKADFKDGILNLRLPKLTKSETKKIKIS